LTTITWFAATLEEMGSYTKVEFLCELRLRSAPTLMSTMQTAFTFICFVCDTNV